MDAGVDQADHDAVRIRRGGRSFRGGQGVDRAELFRLLDRNCCQLRRRRHFAQLRQRLVCSFGVFKFKLVDIEPVNLPLDLGPELARQCLDVDTGLGVDRDNQPLVVDFSVVFFLRCFSLGQALGWDNAAYGILGGGLVDQHSRGLLRGDDLKFTSLRSLGARPSAAGFEPGGDVRF